MYSGLALNVRKTTSGQRVQKHEQSMGVKSHSCGLTTIESASSAPSSVQRNSSQPAADPAYAASRCSHAPASAQSAAISRRGSTDVVEVVPAVGTTAAAPSI